MNDFGGKSYPIEDEVTDEDRTWAIIAHVSQIVLGPIGPLIAYLVKKDQSRFVANSAIQALGFSLALFVLYVFAAVLAAITCGIGGILFLPLMLAAVLYAIVGTMHAAEKRIYEYPVTSGFVKSYMK